MFQDPKSFTAGAPVGRDTAAVRPIPATTDRARLRVTPATPPLRSPVAPSRRPAPIVAEHSAPTPAAAEPIVPQPVTATPERSAAPASPFSDRTQAILSRLSPERLAALTARLKPEKAEPTTDPEIVTEEEADTPPATNAAPAAEFAYGASPLGFLWRGRALIAASITVAVVAALLFSLVATHRYRAVAQLLISPIDLRVVDKALQQATQTADANVIQVESETRVLTSDKVLQRVVQNEKLAADPEFSGGRSLLSGVIPRLRAAVGLGNPPAPKGDEELGALRSLQRAVVARRTERTYVVDLMVDTTSPVKSARIANAIATAYLEEQSASRTDAARRVTESLSARLSELKDRVRHAEEQVERYKSENNIVGPAGRLVSEQQLTELNNQLTAAKARTAEAKARYEKTLQRNGIDAGSTTEAVQSNTVGRLRDQYAAVARQEATLSAELGPRHPWVIEARAQVRNVQRLITEEVARLGDANRIEYERALANETSLAHSFDALKERAKATSMAFVKLRELEREGEASRAVYESFLVRARETREQEQLDSANVRILSDAQPPRDRFWPPRLMILLLGALALGGFGGAALAYAAERFDQAHEPAAATGAKR